MSTMLNYPPTMHRIKKVIVYDNGVVKETYTKSEGKWADMSHTSYTNQAMRDMIISACVYGCTLKIDSQQIMRVFHHVPIWR